MIGDGYQRLWFIEYDSDAYGMTDIAASIFVTEMDAKAHLARELESRRYTDRHKAHVVCFIREKVARRD